MQATFNSAYFSLIFGDKLILSNILPGWLFQLLVRPNLEDLCGHIMSYWESPNGQRVRFSRDSWSSEAIPWDGHHYLQDVKRLVMLAIASGSQCCRTMTHV